MGFIGLCNKLIRYSFYGLFLLVPLIFTGNTSELFELNKMWVTWGLATVILFAWGSKMIMEKSFVIKRTPLDIPIALFFVSQVLSTIISLDQRVSFFGYYSRFNGGLLSTATYLFIYYAFVSNFTRDDIKTFIKVSLIAGVIVALWGLPAHFGYDPTCLMFRGSLNVACWTDAFKPTVRIFSTLGQPAWLASYLSLLIPFAMAGLVALVTGKEKIIEFIKNKKVILLLAIALLFYIDLLFTNTRAGFLAFWAGNALFWAVVLLRNLKTFKQFIPLFIIINGLFFLSNFIFSTPVNQLNAFTLASLQSKKVVVPPDTSSTVTTTSTPTEVEANITDSANIRLLVWNGAIAAWRANPFIGTGVETFAYAYYQFRPETHNMTSEWDYLYNKAHNEYLNYLTTTGALGLGSYLFIFILFFFIGTKSLLKLRRSDKLTDWEYYTAGAIAASIVTILVANFFGFSVVITNMYLFILPLWFLMLGGDYVQKTFMFSIPKAKHESVNAYQWTGVSILTVISLLSIFQLIRFWQADVAYALGNNLDKVGEYQNAYPELNKAVAIRPTEPVFKDELSVNLATLATALVQSNQATTGAQLATQAITLSDDVVTNHPNNVIYWKSRTRIFYLLSQIDPKYLPLALEAIYKAQKLAPSDAKISYNVGVIEGKNGKIEDAVKSLTETIRLKKDYRDAYYARALFYHQLSANQTGQVVNLDQFQKGVADLRYILTTLDKTDEEAKKTLESWGEKP